VFKISEPELFLSSKVRSFQDGIIGRYEDYDLLIEYLMKEDFKDTSVNNNHPNNSGVTLTYDSSLKRNVGKFSGGTYLLTPEIFLPFNGKVAISFYFSPTLECLQSGGNLLHIAQDVYNVTKMVDIGIPSGTHDLKIQYYDGSSGHSITCSNVIVSDNKWHRLDIFIEEGLADIYVNENLIIAQSSQLFGGIPYPPFVNRIVIGRYRLGYGGHYYDGKIANFRIFTKESTIRN